MCLELYDECVYSFQGSDSNSLLDPVPMYERCRSVAGVATQTESPKRHSVKIQTIKTEVEGMLFLLKLINPLCNNGKI